MREDARSRLEEAEGVLPHPAAALDLLVVQRTCASGRRVVAQLVERPPQVHGRRTGGRQDVVRRIQVISALRGESKPVGRGDPDRGSAADGERTDGVGDLSRRRAAQLHLLVGQPSLVEDDHRVLLDPNDALGSYVPSSHEARYFACSSVSRSMEMPIVSSLSRAISSSISVGTSYTFRSSVAAFWITHSAERA